MDKFKPFFGWALNSTQHFWGMKIVWDGGILNFMDYFCGLDFIDVEVGWIGGKVEYFKGTIDL